MFVLSWFVSIFGVTAIFSDLSILGLVRVTTTESMSSFNGIAMSSSSDKSSSIFVINCVKSLSKSSLTSSLLISGTYVFVFNALFNTFIILLTCNRCFFFLNHFLLCFRVFPFFGIGNLTISISSDSSSHSSDSISSNDNSLFNTSLFTSKYAMSFSFSSISSYNAVPCCNVNKSLYITSLLLTSISSPFILYILSIKCTLLPSKLFILCL